MSALIVVGIIVILGVNWVYSRFCENRRQFRRKSSQSAPGHPIGIRF